MAQMRRQSLVKFDAPLCETIVETPKPAASEVLVRIERCGLCHSDLHIQDGYADLGGGRKLDTTRGMTLPFTLGHEIAGIVEEVGPDAAYDLIGQKKAVFPWIGCGQCRDCANGDSWGCRSTVASPAMCWCRTLDTCSITIRCRSIRRRR